MTTQLFSTPGLEPYLILAQELMRRVYAEDSPEEIRGWLQAQLQRLAGQGNESARLLWEDSFSLYEQIMAKREADAALPESERRALTWPWASWAKYLDPLEPGMLALIAAGDGAGKTLYAENIAEHWARGGHNVVFLHFELNRALMLDRRMVRHADVPRRTLKLGALTAQERDGMRRANDRLRQWPGGITYVHTPGWTMERALAEVHALKAESLCGVFILDYLEKSAPSPRQLKMFASNIYAREADDVEQIKSFAEQQEIPALLLAQLNKIGKGSSFQHLDRTAIRGAGEKTEKANIVVLLHRENPEGENVQVRIDKNTVGPVGSFAQYMETRRFMVADLREGSNEL